LLNGKEGDVDMIAAKPGDKNLLLLFQFARQDRSIPPVTWSRPKTRRVIKNSVGMIWRTRKQVRAHGNPSASSGDLKLGGYGVVANLAFILKKPSVMITADTVDRMLRNCVEAGALDGVFARPTLSDDGVPLEATRACVAMLKTLVDVGLTEVDSPGH
jgi:hypothetical protein